MPKSDGSWRLINHLSAPVGTSINDYIDPIDYSLHYNTTDDAINILHMLGPNALMAKVDLKNAFRLCPVHPADWPLLGIHWRNMYYINKCLLFGLRSAPFLFNMVADSIQWILHHHFHVTNSFHYLDDFFFAGPQQRQLLSLIGKLSFATKVIPAGRIFLRRLLDLAHSVPSLEDSLIIGPEAVLDIQWWLVFAQSWNGTAFFLNPAWTLAPDVHLFTDASSTIGYGAYWAGQWFNQRWPQQLEHHSIEWKEMYAILIACEA